VRVYVRAVERVFEQPAVLQQLHSCGLQQLTERIAATKTRYRWSGGSRAKQRRVAAQAAVTRRQRAAAADMCDDTAALRGDDSSSSSSSDSDSDSNGGDGAAAAALNFDELLPLVRKAQAELQHDEDMPHSSSMPPEAAAAASDVPSSAPAAMPFAAAAANRSAVLLPAQQHQQQQALQQHAAGMAVEGDVARARQLPTAGKTPDPQPQTPMTLAELISRTSNAQVVGQLRQWARLVFGQDVDTGSVRVCDLLQHWSVYDTHLQQKIAWGPDGSPPTVKQETAQHYTWSLSRTLRLQQVQDQLSSQLQQQLAQQVEETKHRLRGRSCTAPQAGAAAVGLAGPTDGNAE